MTEVQPKSKMRVVGINLAVMVGYAVLCLSAGDSGAIVMWMIMLAHVGIGFLVAIIVAITPETRSNALPWVLSAVLILLIGLSTCYWTMKGIGHI